MFNSTVKKITSVAAAAALSSCASTSKDGAAGLPKPHNAAMAVSVTTTDYKNGQVTGTQSKDVVVQYRKGLGVEVEAGVTEAVVYPCGTPDCIKPRGQQPAQTVMLGHGKAVKQAPAKTFNQITTGLGSLGTGYGAVELGVAARQGKLADNIDNSSRSTSTSNSSTAPIKIDNNVNATATSNSGAAINGPACPPGQ